mgnify:FL=1
MPVNSSSFPSAGTDLSVVAKRLNEIYSPAVVNWHVSYDHAIEVGKVNEEDFKVEGTSMLSKYTPDMNKVIRKYKRERPTDDNTMYLFFLNIPDLGSNRKGFMPLAGNYGFIFNFGTDLELLAHELAHGAFNLRHTFSDKAQYFFQPNQTANLLDYAGGTELWKYQWDLIHNPESILFSWSQDESEGALKGRNDYDKVINVIEMLRCGYNSDRKVKFQNDVISWFKESATVSDFDGLYDDNTYKYIYVQLSDDDELIEYPSNLELMEPDNVFNSLLNFVRGEALKLDFGGLFILVDKENAENLLSYLTPSSQEYAIQQRQFVTSIKDLFDKGQYTRQRVLDILRTSPQCLYESLTKEQRVVLLSLINNNSNIPESVENIVIDIIRTTPEDQIEYLFNNLYSTGLLAYFDRVMNNVGSSNDNYTRFIYELLKLYLARFSDNLDCFEATPWGQLNVDNQVRSIGNFDYVYETPFYWWQKGCKVPTWRYGTRGVFISDHNTCGYFNKENVEIDPFEPVVIYFEEDLSFYELPPELESRIVSMPAFVLPWLRNEASNKEAMRMAGNAVTIVESFTPLGATGKVASGLRGVLIKAFVYINKVDATINVLLTNEAIKESINRIGDGKGAEFIKIHENISIGLNLASPTIQGLLGRKSVGDIFADYVSLGNAWAVIGRSNEIKSILTQKEIESITMDINSILEILEYEDIVE